MSKTFDFSTVLSCAILIADNDGASDEASQFSFIAMVDTLHSNIAYRDVRSQWVNAYVSARGCSEKSGQNRWSELCLLAGFVKPQSADAARKTPVKKGARTKSAKPDVVTPTTGSDAAGITFAQLSTIERAIVEAVLKHQWALVAKLADEAGELPLVDDVTDVEDVSEVLTLIKG